MKLNRTRLGALVLGFSLATALAQTNSLQLPPIAAGPFKPEWNSLTNYQAAPEWFRDAKFGIRAHWGPQCEPDEQEMRIVSEIGAWLKVNGEALKNRS